MAAYKIGNFTFDTEEEYARGLEDAKKIEKIQSTVDLNEPETALRLYWLIRTTGGGGTPAGSAGPQQKDSRCGVCDGRISMFWLVFLVRLHESPRQSGE